MYDQLFYSFNPESPAGCSFTQALRSLHLDLPHRSGYIKTNFLQLSQNEAPVMCHYEPTLTTRHSTQWSVFTQVLLKQWALSVVTHSFQCPETNPTSFVTRIPLAHASFREIACFTSNRELDMPLVFKYLCIKNIRQTSFLEPFSNNETVCIL